MTGIIFAIIFAIALFVLFASIYRSNKKREQAMAALAAQQGWTPLPTDPAVLGQYLPQYLQELGQSYGFGSGRERVTYDYHSAYQTTIDGHQVTFFQYQYTEYFTVANPDGGSSQNRQTHLFTVLHAGLKAPEPTVLLLRHTFLSRLADFGVHGGLEKLSLEGDFNDHFDTYIALNSQVEVLSLLTPDVMQQIMVTGRNASLQIGGQTLALSLESQYLSPKLILPLLQNVTSLLKQIDERPSVQLATMATDEQPVEQSSSAQPQT